MSLFRQLGKQSADTKTRTYTEVNGYGELPSFIQRYVEHLFAKNYSKTTIQRYVYDFLDFFRWVQHVSGTTFTVRTVTLEAFAEFDAGGASAYAEYLALEQGNAPSVINRKLSAMQSLVRHLVEEGRLERNPFQTVDRPKRAKRNPVYLTEAEWREFTELLRSDYGLNARESAWYERTRDRDYLIVMMLGLSGLRVSELVQIDRKDIDLEERTLRVIGKGNKERLVPLAPALVSLLQDRLRGGGSTPLLTRGNGERLSVRSVQHLLKRHIERLQPLLPFLTHKQITPHKLRHTFATRLTGNGVDVLTIQQLLGHESVATTQVYAHISDERKRRALDGLL